MSGETVQHNGRSIQMLRDAMKSANSCIPMLYR